MKIYISGKYSGLPRQVAVNKFNKTKQQLIEVGVSEENIWNPVEYIPEGLDYNSAMKQCLGALDGCQAIFMQRDWRTSNGAIMELNKAMKLKLDIYYEEDKGVNMIANLVNLALI